MNDRSQDKKYLKWARQIKERDNYICQICQKYGGKLHSHHINSWDTYIDQRYELFNGITLCSYHHERFHDIYNRGGNTYHQFEEFKWFIKLLERLARKNIEG